MENLWNKVKESKTIWVILSIIVLVAATTIGFLYIFYFSKTRAVSSNQNMQALENTQQQNTENTVKLEDLQDVSEMTEEELKKANEKELEEAKKKEENENKKTTTNKSKYYIKVNYGAQLIDVYTYDSNGNYTKRVKTFICSTGTETPRSGVYKIPAKITWLHMFGDVFGHYCTQIVGNILFHSVPYLVKGDPSTLEYWEYDKLGTKASMGCIRMTTADALWIFNNVSIGTPVEFYSDSSQAYRRPSAQKISNAPSYLRGWDPTDPNPDNPWRDYKPEEEEEEKPTKPEQPTKPSDPSEEKPPVEEKPEEPEQPTEPEEPEEPQEPENPTDPEDPDEPEEPEPPATEEPEDPDDSNEEENGQSGNSEEENNQNTENTEISNEEKV